MGEDDETRLERRSSLAEVRLKVVVNRRRVDDTVSDLPITRVCPLPSSVQARVVVRADEPKVLPSAAVQMIGVNPI